MRKLVLATITGGIVGAVIILLFMFVFDINKRHEEEGLRLVSNDSTDNTIDRKQKVLMYGEYKDLDSTDYLLIPLGMKTLDNPRGMRSKASISSSGNENTNAGNYRNFRYNFYSLTFEECNNIIFYNKKTEETHLLLQKPAIISRFYFPYYDKEYKDKKYWFILVGIHEDDSNTDGYINGEDAEKIYAADLAGANLIQITPDNTQLDDWYIEGSTNSVLLKVRHDSNNDQKFNDYDEVEILKVQIGNFAQGRAIINSEIKNNIQGILKKIK